MIEEDVAEILKNNPQITKVTFTFYPNEKDLFWRGFKSALGACAAVLLCISIIMFLVRLL